MKKIYIIIALAIFGTIAFKTFTQNETPVIVSNVERVPVVKQEETPVNKTLVIPMEKKEVKEEVISVKQIATPTGNKSTLPEEEILEWFKGGHLLKGDDFEKHYGNRKLKDIRSIGSGTLRGLTPEDIDKVLRMENLRYFSLNCYTATFTTEDVIRLNELEKLKRLSLTEIEMTDDDVEMFAEAFGNNSSLETISYKAKTAEDSIRVVNLLREKLPNVEVVDFYKYVQEHGRFLTRADINKRKDKEKRRVQLEPK